MQPKPELPFFCFYYAIFLSNYSEITSTALLDKLSLPNTPLRSVELEATVNMN